MVSSGFRTVCWALSLVVLLFPSEARAQCPADVDGSGDVGFSDLLAVLTWWGPCSGCAEDLDDDGLVGFSDLLAVLSGWGSCPGVPPGMVLVPGGEYEMGCHADPLGCSSDELPVHAVFVRSFNMSVYEVTNQQYAAYLNSAWAQGLIEVSGGVVYKAGDSEPYCDTNSIDADSRIHWDGSTFTVTGQELPADHLGNTTQHPMVEVSWYGAAAYCNWLSAEDGRQPCYDLETWACDFAQDGYRLPTEAEWEYAARGGLHDPYYQFPWGDDIDGSKANYGNSGDPWDGLGGFPYTSVVGYYDGDQIPAGVDMANGYGLYDMAGNVWDWCNDWYGSSYYASSPFDNPQGPGSGSSRVIRGGSWINNNVTILRCAFRSFVTPDSHDSRIGIRVAALCANVTCPQPGACCLPIGTCVQSFGDHCALLNGVYHGDATLCTDVVCESGACCFPNETCSNRTEQSCENAGGTFAGEGVSCSSLDCTQGACCFSAGGCVVVPQETCEEFGGTYQGGGSTCETVSCP